MAVLPENASWMTLPGNGEHLHFYHATGFPAGVYTPLLSRLSDQFSVSALNGRPTWENIGPVPKRRDWEIYADDLVSFIEKNYQSPVIGVGHSLGAVCTLFAAEKRPDLFKALVFIEPAMLTRIQAGMIKLLPKAITNRAEPAKTTLRKKDTWDTREAFLDSCRESYVYKRLSEEAFEALAAHGVVPTPTGQFTLAFPKEWEAHIYSQPPNVMAELQRVDLPCVGIRAKPSLFFTKDMWGEWQKRCPNTVFLENLDYGHLFPLENPDDCFKLIRKGLDEIL